MLTTALTRAVVQRQISEARSAVLALGVERLALFGSVQRDSARADSDVDILVEFRPGQKTYDHFLALGDLLEGLFGCRVELVTLESLSPFLKPHILAEARDVLRAA